MAKNKFELKSASNPQIIPDGEILEDQFNKIQNRNEAVEVLKELFDPNKIHMISHLTQRQINLAVRIHMIAEIKHLKRWDNALIYFMKLVLSKDRASRKELLEGMRNYEQSKQQSTNPFYNQWGGR